jgi:hypothetical protein
MKKFFMFGKHSKLTNMFPFLDDESLHELVLQFIEYTEKNKEKQPQTANSDTNGDNLSSDNLSNNDATEPRNSKTTSSTSSDFSTNSTENEEEKIDINSALPFLPEDDIALLIGKIVENGGKFGSLSLGTILPFSDDESIDNAFLSLLKQGIFKAEMLPFVSDECLHEVAVGYCKGDFENLNIDAMYPFMDDKDINMIFKTYIKKSF